MESTGSECLIPHIFQQLESRWGSSELDHSKIVHRYAAAFTRMEPTPAGTTPRSPTLWYPTGRLPKRQRSLPRVPKGRLRQQGLQEQLPANMGDGPPGQPLPEQQLHAGAATGAAAGGATGRPNDMRCASARICPCILKAPNSCGVRGSKPYTVFGSMCAGMAPFSPQ